MKENYDFSNGERGKFYRSDAKFNLPAHLDDDALAYLNERTTSKGVEANQLINDMLKKDIDLIEVVK